MTRKRLSKLLLIGAILCLTGCLTVKAYDPITVQQIEATISFETKDYLLSKRAIEDDRFRLGLTIRHESELARLKAWLRAEKAKKLHD